MGDNAGLVRILIAINGGTLLAILVYGYKIITFFNGIKFKTDILWKDYETRIENNQLHYHMRASDQADDKGE